MKYSYAIIALSALMTVTSCSSEMQELETTMLNAQAMRSPKIINTPNLSSSPSILVKFEQVPTNQQLQEITSANVLSIKPLFVSSPGKKELEAAFGLDRWYQVIVDDQADMELAAAYLAAFDEVKIIEFDSDQRHIKSDMCFPVSASQIAEAQAMTRAEGDTPFNDPLLRDQWHYINRGDVAVSANAVKGADINVKDVWTPPSSLLWWIRV